MTWAAADSIRTPSGVAWVGEIVIVSVGGQPQVATLETVRESTDEKAAIIGYVKLDNGQTRSVFASQLMAGSAVVDRYETPQSANAHIAHLVGQLRTEEKI